MMDLLVNPVRGEAPCQIGNVKLVLVVEFARLAQLCQLADCDDMQTLYRRLIGFHPKTVMAAIRTLTTHPDGDEAARELAHNALKQLSGADEPAFREAITQALSGHIAKGRATRGDPDPVSDLEKAFERTSQGNAESPSV